ncbi:DUF3858 domain-containing protein [Flavobacterium sp. SUN052]|uniref:DUF3858 domain-containing protein n=1 Tax=Flavobacterium sp. SUN052 TaxID=3002441 RepID=UPI00237EC678|nr:DUF3858 domain-containing protein [Flavobacterium sp. SUN052]MEC4004687.1 DUF3858 domain-containing protein [Flavobacterium sp. SUN052]
MKKIFFIVLFLLIGNFKNYAQKHELGNVTIDELKEQVFPKDSAAVAAILFEKGKTYFEFKQDVGFSLITEVEVKIKVYKKEGYDWANKEVSVYVGGNSNEVVDFSKAITYNLVNNQIEKTKLKSDGEFFEKVNKFWSKRKITLPNVKEGSIVEYKYTIRSPYISTFPDWTFQNTIPVNYSEYTTDIPEYYFYNVYRKGVLVPIEIKDKLQKTMRFDERNAPKGKVGGYTHDIDLVNYTDSRTTYKLENIPAMKEESFVNNIDNYRTSVQHELSGKQMPQAVFESFSTTWEDVAKKIYENENFGNQLNKNNYYESDVKTLLQGLTTTEEKINTIFKFVQSKMTWNKFFSYTCDVGVKKAYDDKVGNVAEINLMLVSMLRFANLEANPVLVSTRANGISLYPSRTAFNSVIASVLDNGNLILMDATSKYSLPGILPTRDLNWLGRMIKNDGVSEMVELMPKTSSMDVVNALVAIDNSGILTGKVREQHLDYNALRFRENNSGLAKDVIIEKMEKAEKGLEVSDYELSGITNLDESLVEKYTIKNENIAEIIGDKMYFAPMLYFADSENPFKQDTREYPIDFSFPFKNKYMFNITIPDGYQVETLPKPISIAMDNKYGSFNYAITNTNSQIQLSVNLDVATSIIPAEDYFTLKEFFKVVIEKENEKIVLKKK